jgi:hypothetical protein
MKTRRKSQGQMRVIEVIIALFIIVVAISFANFLSIAPTSPKYEATELQKLGYNVLHDLDKQDILPRFVYGSEWQNLTAALRVTLPINVYFRLTVYRIERTTLDGATTANYVAVNNGPNDWIQYGDSNIFSLSKDVASITYGVVGYPAQISQMQFEAEYSPRILILELSRG